MSISRLIDCRSVYIGGPISLGGTLNENDVEINLVRFRKMETQLQVMGHSVFSPERLPKFNRFGERALQEDYLEQCIWMVMQADGMVALNGWEQSPGTCGEAFIAQLAGKPVFKEDFSPLQVRLELVVRPYVDVR